MEKIVLTKLNEVYMRVTCDRGITMELSDFFSYFAASYQFNPKFKEKMWDGKIRLLNIHTGQLYIGLMDELKKFCMVREYELEIDPELEPIGGVTEKDIHDLIEEVGAKLEIRDYQMQYVLNAINKGRSLSLSPTSSGKSFIQYLIQQYYQRTEGVRSLIVVPTVSLVLQMKDDFVSYGCDPDMIHTIKGGSSKVTNHPIVISTWQSLQGMSKDWFRQFELVCGDEAHLFTAKSLITIMESLSEARYRHGFSGTIPKSSKVNQMLLEGVFGGTTQYVTTSDLIASGTVADFRIKAIVLKHSKESSATFKNAAKKLASAQRYAAEKVYLANHTKRNNFIVNLVKSQKDKNALILFDLVEKQGKVLLPLLQEIEGRKVHFIHGGVSGEERERIRKLVENDPEKNHIILASSATLSTGFSLKRLDYVIFSASSKSEVRVLQSIGRVLRKGNGSDDAVLYDIADDLSFGSTENYTLQHFRDRIEFYTDQQFDMKVFTVNLD